MSIKKIGLVLLMTALAIGSPIYAQEATPVVDPGAPVVEVGDEVEVAPEPPPTDIGGEEPVPPNVDEATDNFLRIAFAAAVALFVDAPVTVVIVSVLKRFKALDFFTARTWSTIVAILLWLALAVAQMAGYELQFTSLLKVVETTLPSVSALFLALVGTGAAFKVAVKTEAPIVSYVKPADRQ